MGNRHVVGGVPRVLTPEQQLEVLLKFRNQRGEIEDQLIRGDLTNEDVQALIEHRPTAKQGKGPSFTFRNEARFSGCGEVSYIVTEAALKWFDMSDTFITDILIHCYPEVGSKRLAIVEFFGTPTDAHIWKVLGTDIVISLQELFWARDAGLIEPNWHHIAYVRNGRGDLKLVRFFIQSGGKTHFDSTTPSTTSWHASNIRVLCRNTFQPV